VLAQAQPNGGGTSSFLGAPGSTNELKPEEEDDVNNVDVALFSGKDGAAALATPSPPAAFAAGARAAASAAAAFPTKDNFFLIED